MPQQFTAMGQDNVTMDINDRDIQSSYNALISDPNPTSACF